MSDIPTQAVPVKETVEPVVSKPIDKDRYTKTTVEPPFTMYKAENKLPLTADYMDVKLTWDEADMVGDITTIEDYLKYLVYNGDIADSTKAAREKLKKMEKMAGIDQVESQAQRIIKLAEFVKYLQKIETRKYGYSQN